jgi:hexokinase
VTLNGNGQFELTQAKYRLTEEQKQEDGQKLFDFCAQSLGTFITTQLEDDIGKIKEGQELALGFTVRSFNTLL